MECHDARLALTLLRRDAEALDAAELDAVERHVELCPGCQTWNQSEARFESAAASAMKDVPVPRELKGKISSRLAAARRPWLVRSGVAAAAVMLALAGGGAYLWLRPVPIDFQQIDTVDDEAWAGPQTVKRYFADLGYPMTPPPDFNFDYLSSYKLVAFQGVVVPRLTFRARQPNGSHVTANVYCLPASRFRHDGDAPLAGNRQFQVIRGAGEFYLVDCTGGSVWTLRRGTY